MWQWLVRKAHRNRMTSGSSKAPVLASGHQATVLPEQVQAELHRLDDYLFGWLLEQDYHQLVAPAVLDSDLEQRLNALIAEDDLASLPRQPRVLPQLMSAVGNPSITRPQLTEIILADPALTDQMLKEANSPFFRPSDQAITSVDHAIFMLGVDGIRNVIAAAVMRPMMAARSHSEAHFAHCSWRWGLSCARAAELIARDIPNEDANSYFMTGLMPALAYLTLFREINRLHSERHGGRKATPQTLYYLIARNCWEVSLMLAEQWALPPRYHALLLAAQRPSPVAEHTPLNDGIILGTREVLRAASQRNLPEDILRSLLRIAPDRFPALRQQLVELLRGS